MKFSISYPLVLLFVIVGLHFVANATWLYETEIVWFDNILHALAGIAFGLLWLWVREKKDPRVPLVFRAISTIVFVFGIALLWELLEFLFLNLFPSYAYYFHLYSPSMREATLDVLSNMMGALALVLWVLWVGKRNAAATMHIG
ncbi:MAG: hypothetical protein AAB533_01380 [Patescibacteria group bacterium]